MALEDKKVPYEILIRYSEDGTVRGAHAQFRRIVTLDGETLKDEVLPAEPLEVEGFPTMSVMTDTTKNALARVTALEAEIAETKALVERKDEELGQLRSRGVPAGKVPQPN